MLFFIFVSTHRAQAGSKDIYIPRQPERAPIVQNLARPPFLASLTNDTDVDLQYYLTSMHIDQAWTVPRNGKAPIVAVIDDGVDTVHPDLLNQFWINTKETPSNGVDDDKNGFIDDYFAWNFLLHSDGQTFFGTHATLVAGIVAALKGNSQGVAGINYHSRIMDLTVCDSHGLCDDAKIDKAIRYAADNGARVINLSLASTGGGFSNDLDSAIAYARDRGVVVVAAAGNAGENLNSTPESPVCNDLGKNAVVGVGAIDQFGAQADFSNFGSNCVDVFAPGVNIESTAAPAYAGSLYDSEDGTSFSTPIIAGIISLMVEKYTYITPSTIVNLLKNKSSNGVPNAYAFLTAAYTPPVVTSISTTSFTASALTGTRTFTITGTNFQKPMKIMLGGVDLPHTFLSSTKVQVTLPLSQLQYGSYALFVTNPDKQNSMYRLISITQ